MFSYKDQLSIIEKINLREGEHKTLDCPFCGGRRKFTIDKIDGVLVWNCFRASCAVRGSYRGRRDMTAIKNYLSGKAAVRPAKRLNKLPELTTSVLKHVPALEYLHSVNSLEAFEKGYIKIRYAPADNRVVFYTNDETGAVGRALDKRLPKWWNYGDISKGIHVGSGTHGVLVEDVASACSVSRLDGVVGIAMLGTNLTSGIRTALSNYHRITLVLDNDASRKAVSLTRKYNCISNVRLTVEDLKWLDTDQIKKIL